MYSSTDKEMDSVESMEPTASSLETEVLNVQCILVNSVTTVFAVQTGDFQTQACPIPCCAPFLTKWLRFHWMPVSN